MSKSKHSEAQIIAALKQVEAGRAGKIRSTQLLRRRTMRFAIMANFAPLWKKILKRHAR